SRQFAVVNVEGAGAVGQKNLRRGESPFLGWQRLAVSSAVGDEGVRLFVDGQPEGTRARTESTMAADRLVLGGRYTGGLEGVHFLFAGEIAEVIVYDRVLTDDERARVDAYLAAKYADAAPVPPPEDSGVR